MYFGKFDVDLRIETEREKLRRSSRKAGNADRMSQNC